MDKDHILLEYDVVVTLPRHYLIIQTNVVIMHTLKYACNVAMHITSAYNIRESIRVVLCIVRYDSYLYSS